MIGEKIVEREMTIIKMGVIGFGLTARRRSDGGCSRQSRWRGGLVGGCRDREGAVVWLLLLLLLLLGLNFLDGSNFEEEKQGKRSKGRERIIMDRSKHD